MSLTAFLKTPDIKKAMKELFPLNLDHSAFPAIKAPPQTTNYATVGQAFDYLLRFTMQKRNPAAPQDNQWVADFIRGDEGSLEKGAMPFLEQAHERHTRFLTDGKLTDELLSSCLDLASIDGIVRAGEVRGSLGVTDPRDLKDLRNLYASIPTTPFFDGAPCILNPIFRFPSGADCDLLIGDILIEIKTTKNPKFEREYYNQLLGYYLLHLAKPGMAQAIQSIGVYFSRHGYLWTIPLADIASSATFQEFLPTWQGYVDHYHHRSQPVTIPAPSAGKSLETLIAEVDQLKSSGSYEYWLQKLSTIDFQTWKNHPTAAYYVRGALEHEEERRQKRTQHRPVEPEIVDVEVS